MYDVDEAHMKAMNLALGSDDGTAAYLRGYVESYADLDGYLDLIGRERIAELSSGPSAFLVDPYRRWLLPHAEALALTTAGSA